MTKQYTTMPNTEALYEPFGIVEAVRSGNTIYLSGQVGIDAELKPIAGFEAQAKAMFQRLKEVLEKAGGKEEDIVQVMAFIEDPGSEEAFMDRVMKSFGIFKECLPKCKTTSTAVGVARLAIPGGLIEMQAIAVVD